MEGLESVVANLVRRLWQKITTLKATLVRPPPPDLGAQMLGMDVSRPFGYEIPVVWTVLALDLKISQ